MASRPRRAAALAAAQLLRDDGGGPAASPALNEGDVVHALPHARAAVIQARVVIGQPRRDAICRLPLDLRLAVIECCIDTAFERIAMLALTSREWYWTIKNDTKGWRRRAEAIGAASKPKGSWLATYVYRYVRRCRDCLSQFSQIQADHPRDHPLVPYEPRRAKLCSACDNKPSWTWIHCSVMCEGSSIVREPNITLDEVRHLSRPAAPSLFARHPWCNSLYFFDEEVVAYGRRKYEARRLELVKACRALAKVENRRKISLWPAVSLLKKLSADSSPAKLDARWSYVHADRLQPMKSTLPTPLAYYLYIQALGAVGELDYAAIASQLTEASQTQRDEELLGHTVGAADASLALVLIQQLDVSPSLEKDVFGQLHDLTWRERLQGGLSPLDSFIERCRWIHQERGYAIDLARLTRT